MKNGLLLLLSLLMVPFCGLLAQTYSLASPDGMINVEIAAGSTLSFSVSYKGSPVIAPSEIAMVLDDGLTLGHNVQVRKKTAGVVNETLKPVVALKSATIQDQYKVLTLTFRGHYSVEFRAYNDGVAYRFVTAQKKDFTVQSEVFDLSFPQGTTSLFPMEESLISHYERHYVPVKLDTLKDRQFCSLPVLMKVQGNVNVLFTEADVYDYPAMFMYGTGSNGLRAGCFPYVTNAQPTGRYGDRNEQLDLAQYIAKTHGSRTFPWRVMMIGDDDGTLLKSQLVYQLSRPLALEDTDWIKPGKVAWDWYNALNVYDVDFKSGINTATYKYYIDFAASQGIEYIILDEGWSKSTTEVLAPAADIDLKELIAYGQQKNVGIILWLLWKPLDAQLDKIVSTYAAWGIKGIKVDFMQRADQYMVNYYERVAAAAAQHHLLVDFHGAFKPSGLRRAYPNVLSYEGVKGNENNKWSADVTPEHTVTLPFTRMVSGPMDFTPGAMANAQPVNFASSFDRPMSLGTRCHQVAMYVIYESPLQMLCDTPSAYARDPKTTTFIAAMPTTWDETRVLHARIGDYVVMARRKGDTWYVGAMTDESGRDFTVDLSFLPSGTAAWEATLMRDGINADRYAEDYVKEVMTVTGKDKLSIHLAPGGGWAAIIKAIQ